LSALAQRYAAALADIAQERGNAEAVKKELNSFVELFAASDELRKFLESPAVQRATKQGVIDKLAARMGLSAAVRNFLFVLMDNRRTGELEEIRRAFDAELNARLGIAEAQVTSARELSAAEKGELVAALARLTGKKIEARYGTDESLIAGAVVRIGSTIYDGSVREQLNRLRARLQAE
jgi:F-type H+-transporting ATPase subunit delta